ncbi:MAG: hypothetical protein V1743_00180 [Nanoarchaeota archaeon]
MKEKFNKLREKYSLPSFEELNDNFDIAQIEKEEALLKQVMTKMMEKVEGYAKLLEELIHPENSLAAMYECNIFNAAEKKKLFQLYKRLLYYSRSGLQAELTYEEKGCAEFIKTTYKEWMSLKKELNEFLEKMKNSWIMDLNNKMDSGYFG